MIATGVDVGRHAVDLWRHSRVAMLVTLVTLVGAAGVPAADDGGVTAPQGTALGSPDPLAGTEQIEPKTTWPVVDETVASMLPPRSDTIADWTSPLEPLHVCGEPRLLPTCVPPPPCHPALPPQPFDLVGVRGAPTAGPIYRGPCCPRTGSHDCGPCPRAHRVHDRLFDWFYNPRTPIFP